jgi:hypothetical protein
MEWMMILVRSSSGSGSIKHTVGIIEVKGRKMEIAQRRGLEIEKRRGLKLAVMRDEVGKGD